MYYRLVRLKRERNLNGRERLQLDGWMKNYPELTAAYRLKEGSCGIHDDVGSLALPPSRHTGL